MRKPGMERRRISSDRRPAAEALTPEFLTKVRSSKPTVRNVSDAEYEATKRRGRPVSATHKVRLTMRVDPDVEAFFRATGRGWQTRINDALANVVRRQRLSGLNQPALYGPVATSRTARRTEL